LVLIQDLYLLGLRVGLLERFRWRFHLNSCGRGNFSRIVCFFFRVRWPAQMYYHQSWTSQSSI
jgi:hypothetical protein